MRAISARKMIVIAVAAVGALALHVTVGAQPADPLLGTWKLDVAKSTYKPGPAPKSATVTIDPEGKGIKVSIDAVMADGPMKWGYSSARDGKDSPVTGNPNYDSANVTQNSPTEGTIVYKKGGKTIVTAKTSISKDGKSMTVTSTGTDPKGQAIHNVAHYTR
jgi:hypothetical protein